jgi:hypothetical protein
MSDQVCTECGKGFVNKHTLATHTRRIHFKILETSEPVEIEQFRCSSARCSFTTIYRAEWKRHSDKCLFITFDHEIQRLTDQHRHEIELKDRWCQDVLARKDWEMKEFLTQKEWELKNVLTEQDLAAKTLIAEKDIAVKDLLTAKDMEIRELSVRLQIAESQLKRSEERAEEMVDSELKRVHDMIEKCIDRPTTTNNVHTSHHNHITNILVDGKTFQEMTDPERIEEIARQKMRPYWLKGQAGVAEFLYEHVICVDDDKKLIACTDASRKKIKYTNEKNEVEDDLGATKFIAKVYQPIRTVSNELHDNITEQIEQDTRANKIDRFSAEFKKEQAIQAAIDIVRIRDSERNQPFTSKLCSLAKI